VPFAAPPRRGDFIVAPATVTDAGPLFTLEPLVAELGGSLKRVPLGDGRRLEVAGKEALLGPGSEVLVIDRELTRLSQPPAAGLNGLDVPLDLLRATYGALAGYRFDWDPATGRLTVGRGAGRELPVSLDVVHIQGVTTVVLRFPSPPRYRLEETPTGMEVQLLGDRLAPAEPWRGSDPLVRGIELGEERIRIELAAGAAAEGYALEQPFRLVFDVHRAPAAAVQPALPPVAPPREIEGVRTIVLDPGHGGSESGATGPSGVREKDLTLILAQGLKAALERRLPVRVILTRDEDAYLPHDTRTAIANQNKGDLFISLHLNSVVGASRAHGAETYFLSLQASDTRAAEAAELENRSPDLPPSADDDPLHDLQLILWDLAQSRHLAESQQLAVLIQEELNGALELRDRGVKQAPFRVLMGAAMPAVLVELGFISNPDEEARLQDPAYRSDLVSALVRAVARYKAQVESGDLQATGGAPGRGAEG
jgi:N-acetylmuramoyl-L-alanine amidase